MSELKVRFIDDTYVEYYNTGKHDLAQVYLKSEADETIAELKAENQRLKKCEIWMKQHFFCEEVIACESAKNRKLKRALWLARAEKARYMAMIIDSFPYTKVLHFTSRKKDESGKPLGVARTAMEWWQMFQEVERKCRAKAEEYK